MAILTKFLSVPTGGNEAKSEKEWRNADEMKKLGGGEVKNEVGGKNWDRGVQSVGRDDTWHENLKTSG